MLSVADARQATPVLACRAMWLRMGVRPDAFGNALGNGIVDASLPQAQGVGPYSDSNYRNGSDIDSDNAVISRLRGDRYSLATGGYARLGGYESGIQNPYGSEPGSYRFEDPEARSATIARGAAAAERPYGSVVRGDVTLSQPFRLPDLGRVSLPGSYGGDYTSVSYEGDYIWSDDGRSLTLPTMNITHHRGWFSRADQALQDAQDYVDAQVQRVQDEGAEAYAQGRTFAAADAALAYFPQRLIGDTVKGVVGLPRLITSPTMLPGLVNSALHPLDTARAIGRTIANNPTSENIILGTELFGPALLKFGSPALGRLNGMPILGADVGVTASRWTQRLSEYELGWRPVGTPGAVSYAGPFGAFKRTDLRAEVAAFMPANFDLVRIGRGGSAIVRYGDEVFYSVPRNQYSLIPELRTLDTMGDVFTARVRSIADRFDPAFGLTDSQALRLRLTPEGWMRNRFESAYRGSYVHGGLADELPRIPGAAGLEYRNVGPDIVRVGGNGSGLSYEITQLTPSLNAIYSHTRRYSNDLLRYVVYK